MVIEPIWFGSAHAESLKVVVSVETRRRMPGRW